MFLHSHFYSSFKDSNDRRQRKRTTQTLVHRQLKPGAVPSIFPTLPSYLQQPQAATRDKKVLSSSRRAQDAHRMEEVATSFLERDKVDMLSTLHQNLDRKCIPAGFHEVSKDDELRFVYLQDSEDEQVKVTASLLIKSDLSFDMWASGSKIPKSEVTHIAKDKISSCGEALNILAHLKSLVKEGAPQKTTIASCIMSLEGLLPDLNEDAQRKLGFILEQLSLLLQTKYNSRRQYSGKHFYISK